ncbi:glycosyltransferase family 2 protein [Paracnuella aquatica]|uniref:glycosyltransferase family 2 protein n=1 Tax=Paracnuella aquatica TaxID=2268757 RepID=UPI000DEFB37D|nr:glycosyltransferase family 2 protein [Paracnuella aquatica]RPD50821.1 glycosyltransferase family 2 protein [Paracnuella aquatica]
MNTQLDPSLISVVLAACNGARYLAVQLDSVFAQTYPNIEVIAVDDASTDDSYRILQQYAQRHPNMRVYRNEENLGYIKNFERACSLAQGSFIALCDQDDYWVPQKLERLAANIGKHPMIYCDSAICNEDLQPTGVRASDRAEMIDITNCLQQAVVCRVYGHASLFVRQLLQQAAPFPPALPHDWWLCFVAANHGGIAYLPEVLVHYRQHDNNAVGAIGERSRHSGHRTALHRKWSEVKAIRCRMNLFYKTCPDTLVQEKGVLKNLAESYGSFSLWHNLKRVQVFMNNQSQLLAVKKGNGLRKYIFCLKMFYRIR